MCFLSVSSGVVFCVLRQITSRLVWPHRAGEHGLAPDFVGKFDDPLEFCQLRIVSEQIAFFGASEAALGAETELAEVEIAGDIVNPALDFVFRFKLAGL
jgi:hypothetical protein